MPFPPSKRPHLSSSPSPSPSPEPTQQSLLPGLPDHISHLILSSLPPSLLFSVSSSWRRLLYSPSFPPFLSLYAILDNNNNNNNSSAPISFSSFDPLSSKWSPLPPPPPLPQFLLRHPSFIARSLPLQSSSSSSHLFLLSATSPFLLPALLRPLAFHPLSSKWILGPPFLSPRRWCAAGSSSQSLYLFSGMSDSYNSRVARSAERWNPDSDSWEKLSQLRNNQRFVRETVEAVATRGKLCMVSVAAKEGAVYDIELDRWEDMPRGMLEGWTGPVAADEKENVFVVDGESGVLKFYDWEWDRWVKLAEGEVLKGATQMAAGGGRVCVVSGRGTMVAVVAVRGVCKGRIWRLEPPDGKKVMSLHVLPRMPVEC